MSIRGGIATSPDGMAWTARTSPTNNNLHSVAFGANQYVAVGALGTIVTSTDGITWTTRTSPSTTQLNGVTWGKNTYVAVGAQGAIWSSSNGSTWAARYSNHGIELRGVAWSGSQFVAVGTRTAGSEAKYILTSPDGINWTPRDPPEATPLNGVAWTGTQFVGVGTLGRVLTSADGIVWERHTTPTSATLVGIAGSGTQIVAVGMNRPVGGGVVVTSGDGANWTIRDFGALGGNSTYHPVWNGERFVIVGESTWVCSAPAVSPILSTLQSHTVEEGAPAIFSVEAPGGSAPIVYQWKKEGIPISGATEATFKIDSAQAADAGTYTVEATNGAGNVVSNAATLTVRLRPYVGESWGPLRSSMVLRSGLEDVIWDGRRYVATGGSGTILSSEDGLNWTPRLFLPNAGGVYIDTIAYNGVYVAGGATGSVLTSADGTTWTARPAAGIAATSIATDGSGFVAVGAYGQIVSSADGATWQTRLAGQARNVPGPTGLLFDIIWTGRRFVSVGLSGRVQTSDDAATWTTSYLENLTYPLGITTNGSRYVIVGGGDATLSSTDLTTWVRSSLGGDYWLEDVAWSAGRFVACGLDGVVFTSAEGMSWTRVNNSDTHDLKAVTRGSEKFVAVGSGGTILTSADGSNWTRISRMPSRQITGICWDGRQFIAVGPGLIQTSNDGAAWNTADTGTTGWLYGIASDGSQSMAVGAGGVLTTTNGRDWTPHSVFGSGFLSVAAGAGSFVAVGEGGGIQYTSDGVSWTSAQSGTRSWLSEVIWAKDAFFAVGDDGTILTSSTGAQWAACVSGTTDALASIAGNGRVLVAVGENGTILTSTNGSDWERRESGTNRWLYGVTWAGSRFVAVGDKGELLASGDGELWARFSSQTTNALFDVCAAPGRVVAVGENGTTVVVADSSPPVVRAQPQSRAQTPGSSATFVASVSAPPTAEFQWRHNGVPIVGATRPTLAISNVDLSDAGTYELVVTDLQGSVTSDLAALGMLTTNKLIGSGIEVGADVVHPNGRVFDQVLLAGPTVAVTADAAQGQVTRTSFLDLDGDLVQVEFSGPGTLTLTLDGYSPPARPDKYNQAVEYAQGHAGIVISGATEATHVSVFTVGRATAFDPTGAYDILRPPSAENDPNRNGSPLFSGHEETEYDGMAGIGYIAITSTDGKFGSIRTANVHYFGTRGLTGVYAPGVEFTGPVYVGDISGFGSAKPALVTGPAADAAVTGGDLYQDNGASVEIGEIARLRFAAGSTSAGTVLAAKRNQGVLERAGTDVTAQVVVNPTD